MALMWVSEGGVLITPVQCQVLTLLSELAQLAMYAIKLGVNKKKLYSKIEALIPQLLV